MEVRRLPEAELAGSELCVEQSGEQLSLVGSSRAAPTSSLLLLAGSMSTSLGEYVPPEVE